MKLLTSVACLALLSAFLAVPSCTPSSGPPAPPSSAEGSPTPTPSPSPPSNAPQACVDACQRMVGVGCAEPDSCPTTLANVEAHRLNPNPLNSNLPLTCADIAGEPPSKLPPPTSIADVKARGWSCGP